MRYASLEKSPGDDMPYNWDFSSEEVFDSDTIASATATDWSGSALSGITVGTPSISGSIVQTVISGGTVSTSYQIKLKATSTAGRDREAFLLLYVRIPTVP